MDQEAEDQFGQGMDGWDFVCCRRDVSVSVSVSVSGYAFLCPVFFVFFMLKESAGIGIHTDGVVDVKYLRTNTHADVVGGYRGCAVKCIAAGILQSRITLHRIALHCIISLLDAVIVGYIRDALGAPIPCSVF